jgi:hypothetical protein
MEFAYRKSTYREVFFMEPKSSEKKAQEESKQRVLPPTKVQTAEGWKRMMQKKQKVVKQKEQ